MDKIIIISILVCIFSLTVQGQQLQEVNPESAGFSSDRLTAIDKHIENYISTGATPGGTYLIAKGGKVVYFKSFGYNSLDKSDDYDNDDIYRLASMTKAVTSVAIMQLYERGMLGLDDPIHYYIPAFKDSQIAENISQQDSSYTLRPAKNKITVRHLLTHTSGITYGLFNPGAIMAMYDQYEALSFGLSHATATTEEMANTIAKVPLLFEPGEQWSYGLNMEVLGRIVEVASGQELDEYFQNNIFEPLGITDMWFHLPEDRQNRLVPIYDYGPDGSWIMASNDNPLFNIDYPKTADTNHYAGGGGLSGSTLDYAKFIHALLNNGVGANGGRILSRKSIETMRSDQLVMQNQEGKGFSRIPGISFCLGFALLGAEAEGLNSKSAGTYEWGGLFNTKFFIDPAEDLIFVGMGQVPNYRRADFWDRLYAMVYAAIED